MLYRKLTIISYPFSHLRKRLAMVKIASAAVLNENHSRVVVSLHLEHVFMAEWA